MNPTFEFLASMSGRIVRAVAGLILVSVGLWLASDTLRWVLVVVGLVPLAAGLFDFCVFAPFFSLPFNGGALRSRLNGG